MGSIVHLRAPGDDKGCAGQACAGYGVRGLVSNQVYRKINGLNGMMRRLVARAKAARSHATFADDRFHQHP